MNSDRATRGGHTVPMPGTVSLTIIVRDVGKMDTVVTHEAAQELVAAWDAHLTGQGVARAKRGVVTVVDTEGGTIAVPSDGILAITVQEKNA